MSLCFSLLLIYNINIYIITNYCLIEKKSIANKYFFCEMKELFNRVVHS